MAPPSVRATPIGAAPFCTDEFRCQTCSWSAPADPATWGCPRCARPLDFAAPSQARPFDTADLAGVGVPRYAGWLGLEAPVTLGEPLVPLLGLDAPEGHVQLRNEGLLPTGSFKDRGAAAMVGWLRDAGVDRIVVDSSGNAGAAFAAYCAKAGIGCEVYAPAAGSGLKVAQARAYGASVVRVGGDRSAASEATLAAVAEDGRTYGSALWSPAFLLGTQTLAFELWEQCDGAMPDAIVLPVGGGTLLLGLARGFAALRDAGLVDRAPRLIAVQEACCAPIAASLGDGSKEEPAQPLAEGIQVADPPRLGQIRSGVVNSGGGALAVRQAEIVAAGELLVAGGIHVEPTAAAALAGWRRARRTGVIGADERAVVVLTGSGLKTLTPASDRAGAH